MDRLGLTGLAGTESAELSGLFASGTGIWQVAASLVGPIFNAGRTRRQVEAAEARTRESLALYTRTVQGAFAEIEDAPAEAPQVSVFLPSGDSEHPTDER